MKYERESILILNQDFGNSEGIQIPNWQASFNCGAMMDSAAMLLLCLTGEFNHYLIKPEE